MLSDPGTGSGGAFTRRRFFEQLAAVGGVSLAMAGMDALGFGFASAATLPPSLPGGAKGTRIIILGAGLAGLTAAYELGKAGYQVQVLEARGVAGGRVETARKGFVDTDLMGNRQECDFDDGQYINVGPWRIPYHHQSTLHYVRKFGVHGGSQGKFNVVGAVTVDEQGNVVAREDQYLISTSEVK